MNLQLLDAENNKTDSAHNFLNGVVAQTSE